MFSIGAILAVALGPASASAAPASLRLDGVNGLSIATDPALDLTFAGTIEFSIRPDWLPTLGYDPVVVANTGVDGIRYAVHVTADRKSIGLYAGNDWLAVPFDFADGRLHHVALVTFDGATDVVIDGVSRGLIGVEYSGSVTGQTFSVGSLGDNLAPFTGTLAGLRIWNTPLNDTELDRYRNLDAADAAFGSHPALPHLVATMLLSDGRLDLQVTPPAPVTPDLPVTPADDGKPLDESTLQIPIEVDETVFSDGLDDTGSQP